MWQHLLAIVLSCRKKVVILHSLSGSIALWKSYITVDLLAQLVEHHTFNVGVLGSNPKQVTQEKKPHIFMMCGFFVMYRTTAPLQLVDDGCSAPL